MSAIPLTVVSHCFSSQAVTSTENWLL